MGEDVAKYDKDAKKQRFIAKTDFANIINSSIKKIHGLKNLTAEEAQ